MLHCLHGSMDPPPSGHQEARPSQALPPFCAALCPGLCCSSPLPCKGLLSVIPTARQGHTQGSPPSRHGLDPLGLGTSPGDPECQPGAKSRTSLAKRHGSIMPSRGGPEGAHAAFPHLEAPLATDCRAASVTGRPLSGS